MDLFKEVPLYWFLSIVSYVITSLLWDSLSQNKPLEILPGPSTQSSTGLQGTFRVKGPLAGVLGRVIVFR